jgi:hypothetical protein
MLYSMRKVCPAPLAQLSVTGVAGVSLVPLAVHSVFGPGTTTPCADQPMLAK